MQPSFFPKLLRVLQSLLIPHMTLSDSVCTFIFLFSNLTSSKPIYFVVAIEQMTAIYKNLLSKEKSVFKSEGATVQLQQLNCLVYV